MLSFFTLENRKRNTKIVCDGQSMNYIKDIPYILFIFVIIPCSIYYCHRLWYYIY